MGFLIIDPDKCKKDGICVGECPLAILHQQDKNSFPEMVAGGEGICLRCGHCVAVCPHNALSLEPVPLEACPVIDKNLAISEDQAIQFLRSRRSVRFFKDRPVEQKTLQHLIDIARYAPTGGNSQLVEWTVFNDKEKIHDIAGIAVDGMKYALKNDPNADYPPYFPLIIAAWDMGMDAVLRDAPALVIASAPAAAVSGMVDVSLALSYLELAAQPRGIGTCWAGIIHMALHAWQPLKDAVGLPAGHVHHYAMMLGHAKPRYFRLPERKKPTIHWK